MTGLAIIAPLALVVLLGMALKSFNFLNLTDRTRLTRLLYWVVLPCLLFRTMYTTGESISEHKNLFLATYVSFLIVPALALAISSFTHRGDRKMHALCAMASARANNLYLGLPAVVLALGDNGLQTASVYLAISLPGYNLFSIMWGEFVMSGFGSFGALRSILYRLAKNPLLVSSISGLIFALLKIPVPETLLISLRLVGEMATGIALIALGMSLELHNVHKALRRTWQDVLIKLFLHPAVVYLLLKIWPVEEIYMQTAMIISAMPTAVNTFIVAEGMGMDERYAGELVAMTTMLAPLSLPVWIAVIGLG